MCLIFPDLDKSVASGTDFCWLDGAGPQVKSGETIIIPEFALLQNGKLANAPLMPHTPNESVADVLRVIFDRITAPCPNYDAKDFEMEMVGKSSPKWQTGVTSQLSVKLMGRARVSSKEIFQTMMNLRNVLTESVA